MADIQIVIADPQFLSASGMRQLIASTAGMRLAGEATSAQDLASVLSQAMVDLVVFDCEDFHGFEWDKLKALRAEFPETKWLLITHATDNQTVFRAIQAGVISVLTKGCGQDEIVGAVRSSARGEKFFCNKVLDVILEKELKVEEEGDCSPTSLTSREQEILVLVSQGNSTKEIAHSLSLSHHTINTHRKNIMKKLGANSVSEWVLYAVNAGLISAKN